MFALTSNQYMYRILKFVIVSNALANASVSAAVKAVVVSR